MASQAISSDAFFRRHDFVDFTHDITPDDDDDNTL